MQNVGEDIVAVIGGMMVHSVLKSQQIGQHITTDGKPIPANGGAFPLNTRTHCTTIYSMYNYVQ